jgi:hypothetical protein
VTSVGVTGDVVAAGRARCAATVVVIKLALVIVGFPRTLRAVEWYAARYATGGAPSEGFVDGVARRVVTAAVFWPGRVECLEQSLALYAVLRRCGVPVELKFGMQTMPFGAHAWVEYQGEPINEETERLRQYVVFT